MEATGAAGVRQRGRGALLSRQTTVEPETPRELRALPAPDTPEGRELSAIDRRLHQLVAAVYSGGSALGYDTEQSKEALLFTWDQLTKYIAGLGLDHEDVYYGSMSPQHLDEALGIASSPSQSGRGAPPSHLTGGGPWSLHNLAALEVDKQMQTLWRLERQLQEGFWGRDNWKKSQIRMYGQPIGDMPFDDLILDTIEQVGLPRKWGMLPHRVDIRGRVEADPWTESQVTQEQFETVDRRFKEAMDDHIRSTGLRDARDYLQGVDLHHAGHIVGIGQQHGQGLDHMREMLGSGARREQRLQHIAQSMEMHGSGAPNTRPSAQMLQVSAARLTRKAVTGPPHAGASAPTVIAGTGLIAPAPGWHYMATGELMKDPE